MHINELDTLGFIVFGSAEEIALKIACLDLTCDDSEKFTVLKGKDYVFYLYKDNIPVRKIDINLKDGENAMLITPFFEDIDPFSINTSSTMRLSNKHEGEMLRMFKMATMI